jgi:putative transcriptional regulator
MSIKVTLDEVMERRGVNLTQLAQAIDITLANLSILKTGKAKAMRFSTLEALCSVLDCQPGDILSFDPNEEEIA